MVDQWLSDRTTGDQTILFDGFPRTVPQAEALHKLLMERGDARLRLVRLTIDNDDLVTRLLARAICKNNKCQAVYSVHEHSTLKPKRMNACDECDGELTRRSDDEEAAIAERLKIYHEHEKELLSFYDRIGQLISDVEAHQPIEKVFESFLDTTGYVKE
jgi:adenylate kinase